MFLSLRLVLLTLPKQWLDFTLISTKIILKLDKVIFSIFISFLGLAALIQFKPLGFKSKL